MLSKEDENGGKTTTSSQTPVVRLSFSLRLHTEKKELLEVRLYCALHCKKIRSSAIIDKGKKAMTLEWCVSIRRLSLLVLEMKQFTL